MAAGPINVNGCPDENADSRKRPLDGEADSIGNKRSHNAGVDGAFHFKMLVPSAAAGAIIGKGGETIAQLQKETGARVKMSKANDFYPGTTERVCLISGSVDGIMRVLGFIMEKIREKPDPNAKTAIDFDNKQTAERDKQVKILVPNSTAGMIIGRGGNFIKQIKEESGSYIQISQKAKDQTLTERCITVIGEMENNRQACAMILSKVMDDPQSASCLNVSYADVTGPVANFNPTGSPFATLNHSPTSNGSMHNGTFSPNGSINGACNQNGYGASSPTALNAAITAMVNKANGNLQSPQSQQQAMNVVQLLESIKLSLRASGYSEQAIAEITSAMTVLANYGILGLGLGLAASVAAANGSNGYSAANGNSSNGLYNGSNNNGISVMDTTAAGLVNGFNANSPIFGPIGQVTGTNAQVNPNGSNSSQVCGMSSPGIGRSSPRPDRQVNASTMVDPYDPFFRRGSPTLGSPIANSNGMPPQNNNSFGLGTSTPHHIRNKSPQPVTLLERTMDGVNGNAKIILEIGDYIVGAILGPGGKALVEIQHFSGANIQISKKGIFSPGTRNRVVTITGLPNAVMTAQYLIEQRISEEETKRARQNILASVIR